MVSYLERTVDDTESLVTFICSDAEHLPAAGALKLRIAATLYKNVHTTMSDESVSSVIRAFFEIVGFFCVNVWKIHCLSKFFYELPL